MSGAGRKSEPPVSPSGRVSTPRESRAGFVTMPTELRLFQGPDPTAMKLEDMPQAAAAADALRKMGRGPDVLFEDVHAGPPREPSPDENRAEHAIVLITPGASPWAKDGAAVKDAAAIDKDALPSSSAPSSRSPSVSERPERSSSRGAGRRPDRRWIGAATGLFATAAIAILIVRGLTDGGAGESASGASPRSMGAPVPASAPTEVATGAAPVKSGTGIEPGGSSSAELPAVTATAARTASTSGAPSSTPPAPKLTGEPYVDAGAAPKPSASVEPTNAPVVTGVPTASAVPSASTAPSSKPAVTSTNPFDVIFEKKESGHP